jgi:hypothetical protein
MGGGSISVHGLRAISNGMADAASLVSFSTSSKNGAVTAAWP